MNKKQVLLSQNWDSPISTFIKPIFEKFWKFPPVGQRTDRVKCRWSGARSKN